MESNPDGTGVNTKSHHFDRIKVEKGRGRYFSSHTFGMPSWFRAPKIRIRWGKAHGN
jgi:hypothetical protein